VIFKCEEVLKNIASSVFSLEFNYKEKKLEKIEFIKYKGYSDWKEEDLTPDFIQKNMLDDYEKTIIKLMELVNGKKSVEIVHKFVSRSGKIIFLKAKITLIKKDDTKLYCIGINENITKEKEYEIIFNTLKNSSNVGIIIFRDKIIYASPYICHVLNVQCSEITNLALADLIKNVSNEEIHKYITQRKEGTQFYSFRENVEFVYNEKRFFFNSYTSTVMYKGEFAGMTLLVDVTKTVKRDIFGKIIDEISEYVIRFSSKKKFFNKLIEAIEKNGYKVYLKHKNFTYGDEVLVKSKDIKILVNGSFIYIPFENGEIVISSKYKNEFDESLLDEYKKLKKLIEYANNHIKQTMLLNILKEAIEKSYQWVLITDENGKILYVNDVVEKLSGYKKEELIGNTPQMFNSNYHDDNFYKNLWRTIKEKREIFEDLFIEKSKDGKYFYLKLKIIPVEEDDNLYYVALGMDVTEKIKLQDSLIKDELTSLLNRKGFIIKANETLDPQYKYALFLIDIRNFKALNQVNGNVYGDLILKQFAQFLKTFFYDKDIIARIGSDEFAVLVKLDEFTNLAGLVHKLVSKIKNLDNISVNIGIAIYPKDAQDINELIEKASIALEYAKKDGENGYEFYNSLIKEEVENLINAKNIIKTALENDEFEYFFQPYYSLKENKIVGAEALIRIVKEDEVISPYYFIDYAERSGLIKMIEEKMYEKIPYYLKELKLPLSFNFSAHSFKDKNHISKFFETTSFPLTIEMTEREIASDIDYTREVFDILKKKNFNIAIDDFGTGYSTFTYIRELDFDILKIDMSFIKNITTSKKDFALVKTIITLANELGLKTIAEGVETKEQMEVLKNLGCDIIQGYLIAKPMPLEEMKKFISEFSGID
jgi:diguanylate cyclase (GGDEF)-like protein/PAS domain S-box-containing protein